MSRNPKKIPQLLNLIKRIWKQYPDLRLCQLLENVTDSEHFYYLEDDELYKRLCEEYPL